MNKTNRFSIVTLAVCMAFGVSYAQPGKSKPAAKPAATPMPTVSAPATTEPVTSAVLIEKIEKKEGEVIIPYEKWKLPNGLVIILHEDHSDPIVHVNVTYRVGSNREVAGRTGFAHFFEHMMFQGSEHIADEEHIKIVESAGGEMNGTTDRDRTNYFETMPSNYLETALWLESDRMGFLIDAVTQKKFEVQRNAVKNEKGEGMNRPYGRLQEMVAQNLYPAGHPYSWSTIGYLKDLDAANVQDLKNFFLRWYGPNNAILTVTGDINPKETLKLIEKYFGTINRGPEVKKMRTEPFYLPTDKFARYQDKVGLPLYQFIYPSVKNYDADEAPLDLLASILGDGANSLFYQHFVKKERAVQANVNNPCGELSGEFTLTVVPYPYYTEDSVTRWVAEAFAEFEKKGITDEQLAVAKAKMEAQMIGAFETIDGKAAQLASWEYLLGRTWNVNDDIKRYNRVTKEDIMRVYTRYIKNKNKLLAAVLPLAPGQNAQDYVEPETGTSANSAKEYDGLVYKKATDNFDRSVRPALGAAKSPVIPVYYTKKFDNGLRVIGTQSNEVPVVTMILNIDGGHLLDPNGKYGTASLTADMMNEATKNYTSEAISNELEKLGSSISFSASDNVTTVVVRCLRKNYDATMKILQEKLLNPKFDAADFKRLKKEMIEGLNFQKTNAALVAGNAFRKLIVGDNIFGASATGTEKSVKAIELKDVQDYYNNNYSAASARLTIVGDITEADAIAKLDFLKTWANKTITLPTVPAAPQYDATQVFIVDKPGAPQSQIRIGCAAMPYDYNGDYYRSRLTNYMLGGAFNSRINLNLREEKGYSYGCYSYFSGNKYFGVFTAGGSIRTNATDSALTEFFKEIKNYRDGGITNDDVINTRNSILLSEALSYESSFQKAGFLGQILTYNLPADFTQKQEKVLNTITRDEMLSIAKQYMPLEKMIIVIVGDKDKIKKKVAALNLGKVNDYKLD